MKQLKNIFENYAEEERFCEIALKKALFEAEGTGTRKVERKKAQAEMRAYCAT